MLFGDGEYESAVHSSGRDEGAQEALAQGLQASFTLGSGQFCTKPGLVFGPAEEMEQFTDQLRSGVGSLTQQEC